MSKKPFPEYIENPSSIRLLDGKDRRIRLTLATVRRFERMKLPERAGEDISSLPYEQIAELIWAVLLDKDDLAGPDALLELLTAPMLPEVLLVIQAAATVDGLALKNGLERVQKSAVPIGSASMPSGESSSASLPVNSGPTASGSSPHSPMPT